MQKAWNWKKAPKIDFLNLGTTDILDQKNLFVVGTLLCIAGRLAAPLASTLLSASSTDLSPSSRDNQKPL